MPLCFSSTVALDAEITGARFVERTGPEVVSALCEPWTSV